MTSSCTATKIYIAARFRVKSQWMRAYGGTLPCCNSSEKGSLGFWKNKSENGKMCESGKMYMKNNGTYFNLNK
jgi:hypothetical protein